MRSQGAGYVLESDGRGGVILRAASVEEHIKASIRALLLTRLGERPAEPRLGSQLHAFLFRPLSQSVLIEMKEAVLHALAVSEPRIKVREVEVRSSLAEEGQTEVWVDFEIKQNCKPGQVKVALHA